MPLVPSANTEISRGSISITASVPGMMILQPQNRSHKNTTKTRKVCKAELCTLYPLSDTGKTMSLNHKKYEKSKQNNMFPLTFCKSPSPPQKKKHNNSWFVSLGGVFFVAGQATISSNDPVSSDSSKLFRTLGRDRKAPYREL